MNDQKLDASTENLYLLTTVDNPFNPFTQYEQWQQYDNENKYYTNNYLARVLENSDEIIELDDQQATQQAIDEILAADPLGLYIKVKRNDRIIPVRPLYMNGNIEGAP